MTTVELSSGAVINIEGQTPQEVSSAIWGSGTTQIQRAYYAVPLKGNDGQTHYVAPDHVVHVYGD